MHKLFEKKVVRTKNYEKNGIKSMNVFFCEKNQSITPNYQEIDE